MPKYKFVNASDSAHSFPVSKGSGLVQPHTRRVLDIDEELSDSRIEKLASSGLFVKKTNESAQNTDPMSPFEPELSEARRSLMVMAGQEREDFAKKIVEGGKVAKKAVAAASPATAGASPAPSGTVTPAAPAATTAAGVTTTAGR